jgi:hypothetical protein
MRAREGADHKFEVTGFQAKKIFPARYLSLSNVYISERLLPPVDSAKVIGHIMPKINALVKAANVNV